MIISVGYRVKSNIATAFRQWATMRMKDWITKLNGFLTLNDCDILDNAGKVSHSLAKELAEKEYDEYYEKSLELPSKADKDFDAFANNAVKFVSKGKRRK